MFVTSGFEGKRNIIAISVVLIFFDLGLENFVCKAGGRLFIVFKICELIKKQDPRCPSNVIKFAAASCVFVKNIVDVFESLFKH
jgi:hypothetical protein